MFDIGFTELLLLAAVALVVLGPEELPRVMLKAGRSVGSIKRYLSHWQDELERAADAPKQPPRQDAPAMLPLDKPVDAPDAKPKDEA